jgi:hypothetical protein
VFHLTQKNLLQQQQNKISLPSSSPTLRQRQHGIIHPS